MAIVIRRYALVGPGLVNLQDLVSSTSAIPATYPRAVIEVSIDDAVADTVATLDQQMASDGYIVVSASYPAMIVPDLSGSPTTPAAGIGIYSEIRAGRRMLAQVSPSEARYPYQPGIFARKVSLWTAQGNSTTVSVVGFGNNTSGTIATRNVSTASLAASMRAVALQTSSVITSSAAVRHGASQFWRGNAGGRGGFFYVARFFIDTAGASIRWFVGLLGSSAVIGSTANPSSLTDVVGFGVDSAGATVNWINNDNAGGASMTDLGVNFPANVVGAVYEARIFCASNDASISYSLERLDVPQLIEGNAAADIPVNTTLMSPQVWVNNGITVGVVALGLSSQYIETPN